MATSAGIGSICTPFTTRSWTLTPSLLHHRAGKHHRSHTTQADPIFTEIPRQNLPRSLEPYQHRSSYPKRPTPSMHKHKRPARRQYSSRAAPPASKIPHISIHIATASSGKGNKYKPDKSTCAFDPEAKPPALGFENPEHNVYQKRRARPDSGQDAYFVAPVGGEGERSSIAFGVCDGVGGWAEHGIDPADFSHGLCSYMAKTALEWPAASAKQNEKLSPRQLLEIAYDEVIKDPSIKAGGSTACVGIVEDMGRMRIANLGDSGFLLLRLGAVCSYSNPQTHAFNTPYQMSLTPSEILAQAMIFGGMPLNDDPARADIADQDLRHGDVLVLATDGVWDNLSSQDILTTVSNTMRTAGAWERSKSGVLATDKLSELVTKEPALKAGLSGTLQSVLASTIVGEAKSASLNRKRDGPFAKAWKMHAPYDPYHGGKVDDIAVLVILPVEYARTQGQGQDGPLKAKL